MNKSPKKGRKDVNQIAFTVVQQATGDVAPEAESAAQESGRRGGLKGGKARASKLTPEQRSEIAKKAANRRWAAKRAEDAEKASQNPSPKKRRIVA